MIYFDCKFSKTIKAKYFKKIIYTKSNKIVRFIYDTLNGNSKIKTNRLFLSQDLMFEQSKIRLLIQEHSEPGLYLSDLK